MVEGAADLVVVGGEEEEEEGMGLAVGANQAGDLEEEEKEEGDLEVLGEGDLGKRATNESKSPKSLPSRYRALPTHQP